MNVRQHLAKAIALVLFAAPAFAESPLATVQAHLKAMHSLSAHFTQTDAAGNTLRGNLLLKRPGKIRFEYPKSSGILVVADGRQLYFIDYKVGQVSTWPVSNSPLDILINPSRPLSARAHVSAQPHSNRLLLEAQDPRHPEYGAISLGFIHKASAPNGISLQGWVLVDSQGNRTIVRLSNQVYNRSIQDAAFRWRDPRTPAPRIHK